MVKLCDPVQEREYLSETLLDEGQHFGEISMVYDCPRTATVVSRSYNTLGKLSLVRYKDVINNYPEVADIFQNYIKVYSDRSYEFKVSALRSVPYFRKNLSRQKMHFLAYKLIKRSYNPGEMVLIEG